MRGRSDKVSCGFAKMNLYWRSNDLGLKKLNDWPTFPQLIVKGELVGGLDIVQEMVDNGELKEAIAWVVVFFSICLDFDIH